MYTRRKPKHAPPPAPAIRVVLPAVGRCVLVRGRRDAAAARARGAAGE